MRGRAVPGGGREWEYISIYLRALRGLEIKISFVVLSIVKEIAEIELF